MKNLKSLLWYSVSNHKLCDNNVQNQGLKLTRSRFCSRRSRAESWKRWRKANSWWRSSLGPCHTEWAVLKGIMYDTWSLCSVLCHLFSNLLITCRVSIASFNILVKFQGVYVATQYFASINNQYTWRYWSHMLATQSLFIQLLLLPRFSADCLVALLMDVRHKQNLKVGNYLHAYLPRWGGVGVGGACYALLWQVFAV